MCGIVGFAATSPLSPCKALSVARDTLLHRGPDDAGEWWSQDGRVGLAHRRLSIFDISPLGHQPMHIAESGLSTVFNGEIYNFIAIRRELQSLGYVFRSQSDTEVLLAAYAQWGIECLARFNGMFAFALYDAPMKKLFLCRDRAGEKPLYYTINNNAIHFASELKALLDFPGMSRSIDPEALGCYVYGFCAR